MIHQKINRSELADGIKIDSISQLTEMLSTYY